MVIHNMAHHDSPTENNFQMRVVKQISDPLKRQIDESIRIKDSDADLILNSGSEWRGIGSRERPSKQIRSNNDERRMFLVIHFVV